MQSEKIINNEIITDNRILFEHQGDYYHTKLSD